MAKYSNEKQRLSIAENRVLPIINGKKGNDNKSKNSAKMKIKKNETNGVNIEASNTFLFILLFSFPSF
jgi:hypothetical protein